MIIKDWDLFGNFNAIQINNEIFTVIQHNAAAIRNTATFGRCFIAFNFCRKCQHVWPLFFFIIRHRFHHLCYHAPPRLLPALASLIFRVVHVRIFQLQADY